MKHIVLMLVAALTFNVTLTDSFAAGRPPKVEPKKKVEKPKEEVRPGVKGREAVEARESFEKLKESLETRGSTAGRVFSEKRVEQVLERAGVSLDTATRNELLTGMEKNLEVRQAVNTIDAAISNITSNGTGRLTNSQQQFVRSALEWLALNRVEKDVNDLHMLFEDALKSGYSDKVVEVLNEAIEISRKENKSLNASTKEALKRRGINEEDVRTCRRG